MSTVVPTTKSARLGICICALFICCWCSCICAGVMRPDVAVDVVVGVASVVDGMTDDAGAAASLGAGLGSMACSCSTAAGLNVPAGTAAGRETYSMLEAVGLAVLPVAVRFLRLNTAS
jgi:hypothetical protein